MPAAGCCTAHQSRAWPGKPCDERQARRRLRRHGVSRVRGQRRRTHRCRDPHRGDLDRRSPPGDAHRRWTHRRRRSCLGPGHLRRAARRDRPRRSRPAAQQALCPRDRRAQRRARRRRLQRPLLGAMAPLPLRHLERAVSEPVAGEPSVARRRAARRRRDAKRHERPPRRARLLVVLPASQGRCW